MDKIERADDHLLYRGDGIVNSRPLLFVALSFGLGIFVAFLIGRFAYFGLLIALPIFVIVIFRIIRKARRDFSALILIGFICLFYAFGSFSFSFQINRFERNEEINGDYTICGVVENISDVGYGKAYTINKIQMIPQNGGDILSPKCKMCVYVSGDSSKFKIGSIIEFASEVLTFDAWSYGRLNCASIISNTRYYSYATASALTGKANDEFHLFNFLRNYMRDIIFSSTDEVTASVSYAMLVGDSGYMDTDVLQNFRYGGIAHIFAVSGLHIGILYGLVYAGLRKMKVNRWLCVPIVFSVLFVYCGVCGFAPSSVRALIMCTVLMISAAMGVQNDRINSLSAASIILLIVNPIYLFSVGFKLSIAAAGGIVIFGAHLSRLLSRIRFVPEKVASAIGVAVGAQISTFPIMIDSFGYVSGISLFLNLIFIPVIGAVYAVLFCFTLAAMILPFIAKYILYCPLLLLQIAVTPILAYDLKIALICGFSFGGACILWYLNLFLLSDKINLKIGAKAVFSLLLCVLMAVCVFVSNFNGQFAGVISLRSDYGTNSAFLKDENGITAIIYGKPNQASLERCFLKEGIQKVDDLIILGTAEQINVAVPIVLTCAKVDTLHVWQGTDLPNTFHSISVSYEKAEFHLGNFMTAFIDSQSLFLKFYDKKICMLNQFCDSIPDCDLLLSKESIPVDFESRIAETIVCFEKSANKFNLYDAGNLQICFKNDIIVIKKGRCTNEVCKFQKEPE